MGKRQRRENGEGRKRGKGSVVKGGKAGGRGKEERKGKGRVIGLQGG